MEVLQRAGKMLSGGSMTISKRFKGQGT